MNNIQYKHIILVFKCSVCVYIVFLARQNHKNFNLGQDSLSLNHSPNEEASVVWPPTKRVRGTCWCGSASAVHSAS